MKPTAIEIALVLFACTLAGSIFGSVSYTWGYRQGQIDALSGKVKFELRDQPPQWVERGENQ